LTIHYIVGMVYRMMQNFDPTDPRLTEVLGDDPNGRVELGDLRRWTQEQTQYVSKHLGCCGAELSFEGDRTNYHEITIAASHAPTFIANYLAHTARTARGEG